MWRCVIIFFHVHTTLSPGRPATTSGPPSKAQNEAARLASKTRAPKSEFEKPKQVKDPKGASGFKDFDDFYASATQAQVNLEKFLSAAAKEQKVDMRAPPSSGGNSVGIKSKARATEKINKDLGGDWTRLTDICRATLVTTDDDHRCDMERLVKVYEAIKPKVVFTKNKFGWPMPSGYMDFNLLVNIETTAQRKMVCEVQLHLYPIQALKEGALTHRAYEAEQRANRSAPQKPAEKIRKHVSKELGRCIGYNEYSKVWNECFGVSVPGGKECLEGNH